jgi:hypothetical protein
VTGEGGEVVEKPETAVRLLKRHAGPNYGRKRTAEGLRGADAGCPS